VLVAGCGGRGEVELPARESVVEEAVATPEVPLDAREIAALVDGYYAGLTSFDVETTTWNEDPVLRTRGRLRVHRPGRFRWEDPVLAHLSDGTRMAARFPDGTWHEGIPADFDWSYGVFTGRITLSRDYLCSLSAGPAPPGVAVLVVEPRGTLVPEDGRLVRLTVSLADGSRGAIQRMVSEVGADRNREDLVFHLETLRLNEPIEASVFALYPDEDPTIPPPPLEVGEALRELRSRAAPSETSTRVDRDP